MVEKAWRVSFIPYYMKARLEWSAPKTDDAIQILSKEGFDGVEWMLGHHFNNPADLERLVSRTRKGGLEVSNIMCWQDLVTSNSKNRSNRTKLIVDFLEAAGKLSIPILNVFTGPMTWLYDHQKIGRDISEEKAWSVIVDSFSKIVESAEKNSVIVTVEAVFGMLVHDYYTMREFLSHFESEFLAVNLDPSHLALYGNDPAWAVSRFGRKIRHVHVKDSIGRAGVFGEDFAFPFLGEGAVDWKAFFGALRSVNYSGYLSLEFENDVYLNNVCDGDWAVAASESKKRLSKLLMKK
ncbi:MAG: sugar phosphate isomerase/epimerase [Thaumarchaeota archaeon]|nr:sugar phosphate isomerase/epimerase [Nitrososphaerota archaeon]